MSDKWLAVAFFIPSVDERAKSRELLHAAGASLLPPTSRDESDLVDVEWAGLNARAAIVFLPYHVLVELFIRQSDFLELVEVPPSEHPIVKAFCHACVNLEAEVALVLTHLDQSEPQRILEREWMVLSRNPDLLVGEHFGLLYLDAELTSKITSSHDDRELMPCDGGLMIFSHRWETRWY